MDFTTVIIEEILEDIPEAQPCSNDADWIIPDESQVVITDDTDESEVEHF